MSDDLATITVKLPAEVVDRLRGSQSREGWLEEAALRLARRQSGYDPLEPVGWREVRRGLLTGVRYYDLAKPSPR